MSSEQLVLCISVLSQLNLTTHNNYVPCIVDEVLYQLNLTTRNNYVPCIMDEGPIPTEPHHMQHLCPLYYG